MNICVIGAGYVGLITALCFGKKENKVICVEKDLDKLIMLKKGTPTIFEEGLDELLKEALSTNSVQFTEDMELGVRSSDIYCCWNSNKGKLGCRYWASRRSDRFNFTLH